MRILVTGPTGFIGAAFSQIALACGHELAGLIRPQQPVRQHEAGLRGMTLLEGTLQDPPWKAIRDFAPDACVHTAWITTPGIYLQSPENEHYYEWSLAFLTRLAEFGVGYNAVLGTCLEYQLGPDSLREDATPLAPTTPYADCKNRLREDLEARFPHTGTALAWTRGFYIYGVGEHPARLCSSMIESLRRGETVSLRTPHSLKDYIYIEDLARALLAVVEKRFAGAINLGTGRGVTISQVACTIAELIGRPELVRVADNKIDDPFPYVVADVSRLRSLGWKPQVALQEGIRRLLEELSP